MKRKNPDRKAKQVKPSAQPANSSPVEMELEPPLPKKWKGVTDGVTQDEAVEQRTTQKEAKKVEIEVRSNKYLFVLSSILKAVFECRLPNAVISADNYWMIPILECLLVTLRIL